MAIVEEYGAIAKRLRELQSANPKGAGEIRELERWRNLARQTAREYLDTRRRQTSRRLILPQPTD
jgi:hypothetical protein